MNVFRGKATKQLLARLMLLVIFTVMSLFLSPVLLPGNQGAVLAAEPFDGLVKQAVRNNYDLYTTGTAVDGGWGNFGAVDGYVLAGAGVGLEDWQKGDKSFQEELLALVDATLANENSSSAKRIAYEYILAKEWGETEKAGQLLTILKERQNKQGNGSFDNNAFSDLPAFAVLGRAGVLAEFDQAMAITFILDSQDKSSGAWTNTWQDFQTTAQAVRALTYLKSFVEDKAEELATVQGAIDKGLAWLKDKQQSDGSFQDASGFDDPLIDAVEVLLTLKTAEIEFTDAAWISSEGKSVVDYLTEKALNEDRTFGTSCNLADNTWVLKGLQILGGNIDENTVLAIRISPESLRLSENATAQLKAEAFKLKGTWEEIAAGVSWSTGDVNLAAIDEHGLLTALKAGNTIVKAGYLDLAKQVVLGVTESSGGGSSGGSSRPPENKVRVEVTVTGEKGENLFSGRVTLEQKEATVFEALVKTGVRYEGDSNFITAIEGQKNRGMNGWMVKINGKFIATSVGDYTLRTGDAVEWLYSTDADNIAGVGGKPGDAASPAQKSAAEKNAEEILKELSAEGGELKVNLANMANQQASFSSQLLARITEQGQGFQLENGKIQVSFAPSALLTEQLSKARAEEKTLLNFGAKALEEQERKEILATVLRQGCGLADIGAQVVELRAEIARIEEKDEVQIETISGFHEPVQVTLDLSELKLSAEDAALLTAVRYEKDRWGNLRAIKLGGTYDAASGKFTFYTENFSLYSVVKAEDLLTITLTIDEPEVLINNKQKKVDVPACLIENRTMVPLRFVAEGMGAEVQWQEDSGMVEMYFQDKLLKLAVGKTGPGLEVPAMIEQGRTLVPLRYVATHLGAAVTWFPSTQTVMIVK